MQFIRSFLFNIYVYLATLVLGLIWLPMLLWPNHEPVRRGIELWGRSLRWGLQAFCGIDHEVRGLENLEGRPSLFAAKHQSMWETAIFFSLLKDPVIVLKRELLWIPLLGWFSMKCKMISVDRSAGAKALKSLIAQGQARAAEGREVVIFPEGTRRAPLAPPDYKPGIAALYTRMDAPCIPVATNSGLFWPRRTIRKNPGTIVLEFLPPIAPGLSRKDFESELQAAIETASNRLAKAEV